MAAIVVIDEEHCGRHELPPQGRVTIGRAPDATIRIQQPWISRVHALVEIHDGAITIEDAGSSYGMKARGRVVAKDAREPLAHDDVIELGSTMLVLRERDEPHTALEPNVLVNLLHAECGRATTLGLAMDVVAIELGDEKAISEALRDAQPLARFAKINDAIVAGALRPASAVPLARRVAAELVKRDVFVAIGSSSQEAETGLGYAEELVDRALLGFAPIPNGETLVFGPSTFDLHAQLATIRRTGANVLLEGESGVGKHAVARFLARGSDVHEISAGRLGEIELPRTGTIVIDDVADAKDGKLLANLLARESERVRFVALTRKILRGVLSDDVYFRLAGMRVHLPPLRDRPDDVEVLARHFALRGGYVHFTDDLVTALRLHVWPGNVRELRTAIERATKRASGTFLRREHVFESER